MSRPARRKLLLAMFCVLVVIGARALLSSFLLQRGFRALSDDDYSRVVIAQSFAARPSIDPSGTSWLPFPFWLYGTLMAGIGNSLSVARALGFSIGLLSSGLVWAAARTLGLSRVASVFGSIIAMSVPYSALLGLATTPDVYSAALVLFACATLVRRRSIQRALGAVAISVACLSRYEAWPVALFWSFFTGRDAIRFKLKHFAWLALAAVTAPLLWMLHGLAVHSSALFFVERVTSYQRALGLTSGDALARNFGTPWRLLADAPELWALVLVTAIGSQLTRMGLWSRRWVRPACCVGAMLLFLWLGDLRGSTATHHAGRTLLTAWNLLALLSAASLTRLTKSLARGHRVLLWAGLFGGVLVASLPVRARLSSADGNQTRAEEVAIGRCASSRVPRGELLAIQTPDFGYFAVQAAFARPFDTRVLDRHDPRDAANRHAGPSLDPRIPWLRLSTRWVVTSRSQEQSLVPFATVIDRGPTLLLARFH